MNKEEEKMLSIVSAWLKGKQIRRGLYQSSVGKLINADVNGALNIMRKVFNDSAERIIDRGLLFNPMKLNDLWHLPQVA